VRLRLGTRGSPLALWQARWVAAGLEASAPDIDVEIVPVRTTGDRVVLRPLAAIGGKGLFTKELDQALLAGEIALAVHSLKDLPFRLPDGIRLAAVMPRGDPRDALVANGRSLSGLPSGARIGTGSLRRRAQLLHLFPQLQVCDLRGNVDTRLRKLDDGEFDAIVLSAAGLIRLGHAGRVSEYLPAETVVPAVGQGAVVAVCREDDRATSTALERLEDPATRAAVTAERALLEILEGDCRVPIGGYGVVDNDRLCLHGLVASPDGRTIVSDQTTGPGADPASLGRRLGRRLLDRGARAILDDAARHGA